MRKDKRGIVISTLLSWVIGIVVLVIVILFAVLLKDKLFDLLGYIGDLFRR